jgi:hypothetical protein
MDELGAIEEEGILNTNNDSFFARVDTLKG